VKAVVCREFGPPSLLRIEDVPDLEPRPGEVVVTIGAASLNFPDLLIIQNRYQLRPPLPFSPGSEAAGIVRSVGAGVTQVRPGDAVIALPLVGAFAEQLRVEASCVVPIPAGMDFVHASAFVLAYSTAEHALSDRGELQPGEQLLVLGASGGVGLAAIEVGKALGAHVIACASTDEKLAACRAQGADETINYDREPFRDRIRELTGGRGPDVVFDPVGGRYSEPALRSCAWRGRFLVVGFATGEIPRVRLNLALLKGCSIVGVFWGDFVRREPERFAASVKRLGEWHREGRLNVRISRTLPLDQAPAALEMMANREVVGKVVLVV
jgi:NADPH:quinone reductase